MTGQEENEAQAGEQELPQQQQPVTQTSWMMMMMIIPLGKQSLCVCFGISHSLTALRVQ